MTDYDLKDIMATEGGRRFIWQLLQDCGVDNAALIIEPHASAYQLGRRSVAVDLLNRIRALPDGLELELAMRKEARAQPPAKVRDIYDKFV